MLDEHMEKKVNARGSTVPAKSAPNETKSKQDGAGSNAKFTRGARRREPLASKQDPAFKLPQQPRQKGNYDRRFLPRSSAVPTNDRHRNQVALENETEIGSADRPGSKKLNLNHLLNFTYDRPDGARSASGQPWSGGRENPSRAMWTTRKHQFNKEQYLQASCQFIVMGGHDYSIHSSDPDKLVDWEWIEQVRMNSHEVQVCPICLYPPVAAKMTRCGHIYCWTCILHYLALTDKAWRKCPICYESVCKADLKSVVISATPCFGVGDRISMQLMQREKGSMVVLPKARWRETSGLPFHVSEGIDQCYAKLLLADRRQVLEHVVRREEAELDGALREYAACPEICFVESAIEQLKERKAALLASVAQVEEGMVREESDVDESFSKPNAEANAGASSSDEAASCLGAAIDELPEAEEESMPGTDALAGEECRPSAALHDPELDRGLPSKSGTGSPVYHFYQACDGQHIYMHAVNVHMLVREFGSLEACPDVITAVIVEKEGISMNEGLRRRLRYLGHLPLICEFEVVELQLETPIVSQETIDAFADEIGKRQRRRNRRAKEEHKRERQFEADENRRLGKTPEARIRLNSLKHFPECSTRGYDDDPLPPSPDADDCASPTASQGTADTESPAASPKADNAYSGPSFAQMLRKGKMKPDSGARRQAAAAPAVPERNAGSSEDDDESLRAPSFRDSFCAALQDALDRSEAESLSGQQPDGKKKKRGRQKRLLFSTSVTRSK